MKIFRLPARRTSRSCSLRESRSLYRRDGDVLSLQSRLLANDPEAVLDVQNRVRGPEGYGIWASQGYGTVILFPKSAIATEEELKNVLSFYDSLMSPELANLMYWESRAPTIPYRMAKRWRWMLLS